MEYKHRVVFSEQHKNLIDLLKSKKIKYTDLNGTYELIINESDINFKEIKEELETIKKSTLIDAVYTNQELDNAKWLTVRSIWNHEYPTDNYEITIYKKNKQIADFIIKQPNWKSKNFLQMYWIYDELFISPKAKELLNNSKLKGFKFRNTLNKNKKTNTEIFQLVIEKELKKSLIISEESILISKNKKLFKTGRQQQFKEKNFNNDVDIIKTKESFGESLIASRMILISQKFYKFLKENNLDENLVFEPVELVK